ncbi:pyrroloquinoline quinone biosynthesis peptide chaperone PqqD [Rubellimicrobium roseum]|uniref:Pyrroloquinoline quinone biosynthesis peptide chaperone PqqD n=1 Tax=Rubellimicrobium roseum TaxID=687525 RepID=A0A5C4NG75_9RHOB|nr:pyrroloquinoline quinone biosynthesis peptide chaperone PqqD [Rubellimicrobium roseum]TNC72960.1 pyrroloquinoline quinone biosynthesis peptide chaperone PqqD [Rubellimicrobium roseum]
MRPTVAADSVPRLPRHVKLRHDKARDRWLILVPERVLVPDDTAVAVLSRVDGARSVRDIATDLAQTYQAPVDVILADSVALLQDLADKGFLAVTEAPHA